MVAIDAEHKAKLMHDLNLVVEDAQILLRMTADQVGEEAQAVRERVTQRLGKAKEELKALQDSALQSAKAAAMRPTISYTKTPGNRWPLRQAQVCCSVC